MLPAGQRVRRRDDFTATVKRGRRVGASGLVVHVATQTGPNPARAGFIIGRVVGSAVVRNRVRRQLRHLMVTELAALPVGTDVVIRVTPSATELSRAELAATLRRLLERATRSAATA